jgi:hypothetical protein
MHIRPSYSYKCLCLLSSSSLLHSTELSGRYRKLTRTADQPEATSSKSCLPSQPPMKQLTAQWKHDILVHCDARRPDQTEQDVAALHGVTVGRTTLWEWRQRWDGTPQSLERRAGSGATPILTPAEVSRHVRAPILAANRAHRAVSYTKLLPEVRRKTGKSISVRTLRRIGEQQLGATMKLTRKRTADERQYTRACERACACVCRARDADL